MLEKDSEICWSYRVVRQINNILTNDPIITNSIT